MIKKVLPLNYWKKILSVKVHILLTKDYKSFLTKKKAICRMIDAFQKPLYHIIDFVPCYSHTIFITFIAYNRNWTGLRVYFSNKRKQKVVILLTVQLVEHNNLSQHDAKMHFFNNMVRCHFGFIIYDSNK